MAINTSYIKKLFSIDYIYFVNNSYILYKEIIGKLLYIFFATYILLFNFLILLLLSCSIQVINLFTILVSNVLPYF